MLKILHLSDLHFGPPYRPEVGEAVLRLAPVVAPDVVVVSGDFTQRAKQEQFQAARHFLDRLPPVPRLVVPGNHDVPLYRIWERLTDPLGLYRRYICDELNYCLEYDNSVFVALDTTSPHRTISRGQIGAGQIDFCARALAEAPEDAIRIVVLHHHLVDAPDPLRDQSMLGGRQAIRRLLELRVDLVLGGHLHRAFIGNSLDFFFKGPRDRGVILVQSGTTTSQRGRGRERERNTLNVVEVFRDHFEITHYLYFESDGTFGPMSRHHFPRPGRRLPPRERQDSASASGRRTTAPGEAVDGTREPAASRPASG